jgi:23S rRNA (cytosine1962-C5)-methyltransferase
MSKPNRPPGNRPPRSPRSGNATRSGDAPRSRPAADLLASRPLDGCDAPVTDLPTVRLRSVRRHPHLFQKLIGSVDPHAQPGDLVRVLTPEGNPWGFGLYNPRAEIAVRMLAYGAEAPAAAFWDRVLDRAVSLRRELLRLDDVTSAFRAIHAESDGLPGLVADRLGEVLSLETFSLAFFQRARALVERLAPRLGTTQWLIQAPAQTHGQEGFQAKPITSPGLPERVTITEYGTAFEVNFRDGHKTGFFCDQRENRKRLASFCAGKRVLDLCCYTGGFAVQAKRLGQAEHVVGVDLDETAIDQARRNARLNQATVELVHADGFGYARDMLRAGRRFDVVVLDPPKLIRNRAEIDLGKRKYFDWNRLALQLVEPGGLLLSCSCSGLMPGDELVETIRRAAAASGEARENLPATAPRTVQFLDRTGAGADHPIAGDCPETEYLKAIWCRVF